MRYYLQKKKKKKKKIPMRACDNERMIMSGLMM